MRLAIRLVVTVLLLAACARPGYERLARGSGASSAAASPASAARPGMEPPRPRGLVVPPGTGERLTYCARPLVLTIKVDSMTAPTTRLLAGLGELRGNEGMGRHRTADEMLYVIRGWGHAVFGDDTVQLGPGSMAYVPPGVAHRLVSRGAAPMEYFFVLGPASPAEGFRRAAALGCPSAAAAVATPPGDSGAPIARAGHGWAACRVFRARSG